MRFLAGFVLASVCFMLSGAGEEKPGGKVSKYADETYGFAIRPPAFPAAAKGVNVIPIMMLAAPENRFASNVNIVVQEKATTREEYRKLSLDEMQAAGLELLSDKDATVSKRDALQFEYQGYQQGNHLRWLALAVIDKERVYVVTCTALKDDYPKYEAAFKGCLESFELTR